MTTMVNDPEDVNDDEDEAEGRTRQNHYSKSVRISVRVHDSVDSAPDLVNATRTWAKSHKFVVDERENESGSIFLTFYTPELPVFTVVSHLIEFCTICTQNF